MSRWLHHTFPIGWMIVLLQLLTPTKVGGQNVVYQGQTTTFTVVPQPGVQYEWELYNDSTVDFARVPGNCPATSAQFIGGNIGQTVSVKWLSAGTYFFKVTATNCTNNLRIGRMEVRVEAVIAGPLKAGSCQQVQLDGSTSIGDITRYDWALLDPGGELSTSNSAKTTFSLASNYSGTLPARFRVELMITSRQGITDRDTLALFIEQPPQVKIYSSGKLDKDGSMIVDASTSTGSAINYQWSTLDGKILGATDQSLAKLFGAGWYQVTVTDQYGCKNALDFKFPLELYELVVNSDYARIPWTSDTTLVVLANDSTTLPFVPQTVKVVIPARLGSTRINSDGTITYHPLIQHAGRDHFSYQVSNIANQTDSAQVTIDIFDVRLIYPEGFSPNGDGVNDLFVIQGLQAYPESALYVYTRSGQLVYYSNDYQNDWSGHLMQGDKLTADRVPTGTYYYILKLGRSNRTVKGFVYVGY